MTGSELQFGDQAVAGRGFDAIMERAAIITQRPPLYTKPFILMTLANFCVMAQYSAYFLFPLFVKKLGGSESDIGILMGAMTLSAVLCRPWAAHLVDRTGRKKSFAIGTIIMAVSSLLYIPFQSTLSAVYTPTLVIRLLHGLGFGFCLTASFTYISDFIPPSRLNEGLGMFGISAVAGMALGTVPAEGLIRISGFSAFFVGGAVLGAAALLLQWPLQDSYVLDHQKPDTSFLSVLLRPKMIIMALLALFFGVGVASYSSFAAPYAAECGLPMVSLYFLSYAFAAVITRLLGSRLADRLGELHIAPWAFVINGFGQGLLIFLNGNVLLVLSGLVTGVGHGLLYPCLSALAIRGEPVEVRGKIYGVLTGAIDGGVFVGSIILGFIGDGLGHPAIFTSSALTLFAGMILIRAASAIVRRPS